MIQRDHAAAIAEADAAAAQDGGHARAGSRDDAAAAHHARAIAWLARALGRSHSRWPRRCTTRRWRSRAPRSFFAIATLTDAATAQCRASRVKEGLQNAEAAYRDSLAAFGADAALTQAVAYTRRVVPDPARPDRAMPSSSARRHQAGCRGGIGGRSALGRERGAGEGADRVHAAAISLLPARTSKRRSPASQCPRPRPIRCAP